MTAACRRGRSSRTASAPRPAWVTSAAIIMVAVFAVFGTLSLQQFKQLSVGLSIAVLLDATIVRGVLLPSVMALLGDRNWYLPTWISRRTTATAGSKGDRHDYQTLGSGRR